MRSLNELARIIKAAANNHRQINTVVNDEDFEQENYDLYPIVHIVAGPWSIQGNRVVNKFLVFCLDLTTQDGADRYENLSDTQLVLADIVTQLQKDGGEMDPPFVEWEMVGDATKIVDGKGDNVSGWMVEIYAYQTHERNDCTIPN